MATMLAALEKQLIEMVFKNLPITLILTMIVISLVVIITVRYNKKISEALLDKEQAATMQKQQRKIIRLVGDLPCVSKRNATRLADPKQDGNFLDRPECSFTNALEKGDL